MHTSTVASSSIHRQQSSSSAKACNSHEATIAVVRDASTTPGGSASTASLPRVTMAPLLLKPAVQSCLKNGYRLSLPFVATMPYPSPSILFPSVLEVPSTAADTSASHALAELSRSIRILEDGRRASDPDVKSEFEAALFAWVDQESKQASMGLGAPGSKDDDDRSLIDDVGDGYGADVEDSPYLGAEQYTRGSRIHNGMKLHTKARALRRRDADDVDALGISVAMQAVEPLSVGIANAATPPVHKEPRFSLTTDTIPRFGSPTELGASPTQIHPCDRGHGLSADAKGWQGSSAGAYSPSTLKVPTIVLPQDSPVPTGRARGATLPIVRTPYAFPSRGEAQTATPGTNTTAAPRPREDPFASLNPFALEVQRTAPRPRSQSGPPSGPMCPRMPLLPKSTTSGSLTRLQARRPPALRLSNLPPAGAWAKAEIKANGRGLEGRDMTVRPVYDPRLHGPVPLSAPPFTTPKSKQTANPGGEDGKRCTSTSSKKMEQPPSKLKLRGRAATDAKPLDLGLGLGITNVPQGGFPHPLPYRGVNAPEHTLSGSSDAASAVRRERTAAEKIRKHRGRFETLLAELTKPFDGRKRKASAEAAALIDAAAVATAAARLVTPAAAPVLADSARNAMSAWAKRTFEATTAKGKNAGKIDAPPSAFLASAPVMEPTPVTPIVKVEEKAEPEAPMAKIQLHLEDKPVPALPKIVIQEEIKLTLPVLAPLSRASPVLSVRTGLRRDARNITVAPSSCAITLNSGTTMSETENSPLVPANAVPTAQRTRRDAQGAALTAKSRAAALALPVEKVERPRTGGTGEPPSPRRLAFGVLARQRAPCDVESRRAVSHGGMQRPRGPRRQSSQCRRAVSSNLRCATSMSRQGSQISAHSSSPMLREGSESSFGSFNGCSPRAKAREFEGQPKKSTGTPLLIDCSSPVLNLSPPRRHEDIAQMLGSRSPLTRICDEAKGLMGLALVSADVEDAKLLAFSGTAGSRSQASKENAPNSRAASVLSSPRQGEDAEDAPFISAVTSPAGGAALATPSSAGGLVRQRLLRQRPQTPLDMLRSSRVASAVHSVSNTDTGDVASELQAVLEGQAPSAALLAIALAAEALCDRDVDSISCFSGSTAVEGEALLPPMVQTAA